jgi:hypothetical protein
MSSAILVAAIKEVLSQGEHLLLSVSDSDYSQKLPVVFNASIGGHYRHCLDHFKSVLDIQDGSELDYDKRGRDIQIETDRLMALEETRRLIATIDGVNQDTMQHVVYVRCNVSYGTNDTPVVRSTLGREVMYSIAHAIHHYALIGVICGLMNVSLPENFGVAPSTLQYQEAQKMFAVKD